MNQFIRWSGLTAVLVGAAMTVSAATPSEFYQGLLRRGTGAYEATRYEDAAKQLRIAAFGLVESVEQYQLAQVYLTLTYEKLSDSDRAREAAQRVAKAERVERRYAGLPLSATTRSAFEATAGRLLSPSDTGLLLRGIDSGPAPAPSTSQASATNPSRTAATTPRRTTTPATTTAPPPTTPATTTAQNKPASSQPTQPRNTIPAPQQTTAENKPPQTAPAPAPDKPRPATTTASAPPQPQPAKPAPQTTKPAQQAPTQQKPAAVEARGGPVEPTRQATSTSTPSTNTPAATTPAPAPTPRALTASEVTAKIGAAERGLNSGNLVEARRVYRELLGAQGLDHETLIRVAEGLYRARDFSGALSAFNRLGPLRRGEEPYRYYIAVASYETGDAARAKKELAAALPFIEITPDVSRYRAKIEGSM